MDVATTVMGMMHLINWPSQANVTDGAHYDWIIIGSGVGSIVANRLTENSKTKVLLVEAGSYPSDNALLPSTYAACQGTAEDWNITSTEEMTTKYQETGVYQLSTGKVLGGGSSINHLINLRGAPKDFDDWATELGDDSWSYNNVLKYFMKYETVKDDDILATCADYHGTSGPIIVSNQRRDITHGYLESCEEMGLPWLAGLNTNVTVGCAESSYTMGDGLRQSTAYGYLNNLKRSNLDVLVETTAIKIIFEDKTAKGVTLKRANGETFNVYANKEVIVSAGAFGTPKLLMLSGVGPKEDLEALGIEVIADMPVGQDLHDHFAVILVTLMNKTSEASESLAYTDYPFPIVLMSGNLDSTQEHGDYLCLGLHMGHDTPYTQAVTNTLFTLKNEIFMAMNKSMTGRDQFVAILGPGKGLSKGYVKLQSADPDVNVVATENFYTDAEGKDLENMKAYIRHFLKIHDTTYFKQVNSTIADHGLTACGDADFDDDTFLECFIKAMTVHVYHPTGTCGMGRVTNSKGKVYGFENLRVVDSSLMPNIIRANTMAATMMIAEKISDDIKTEYGLVDDIDSADTESNESKSSETTETESDSSDTQSDSSEESESSEESNSSDTQSDSSEECESSEESNSSDGSLINKLLNKTVTIVNKIIG